MHRLHMLGLNHSTAPLELREKLAFSTAQRTAALQALREQFPGTETVLLSTCNRVEIYIARDVHAHPRAEEMIEFLATFHGVPSETFRPHTYEKKDRDVVGHLFTVASSLDSMVLGETQILGQVREAYDVAHGAGLTGPLLNPLFQRALAVGKQVMSGTAINEGRRSVASVAVDYAQRIFDTFADKTVLSIGAGKMAGLVLQSFAALSPGRMLICNRDAAKAQSLATRFAGEAVPFEKLADQLAVADVVVSSTGAAQPILTRADFERALRARRNRPVFVIDIALPRDVEPATASLRNVYLYNLDDLQQVVSATMSQRTGAIAEARAIIEKRAEEFAAWHRQREIGPVIDQLYKRSHELAQEELARTLNKLPGVGPAEREHLEELARRIVNKLLHDPVHMLRHTDGGHGGATPYVHAMEKLFRLDLPEPKGGDEPAKDENA